MPTVSRNQIIAGLGVIATVAAAAEGKRRRKISRKPPPAKPPTWLEKYGPHLAVGLAVEMIITLLSKAVGLIEKLGTVGVMTLSATVASALILAALVLAMRNKDKAANVCLLLSFANYLAFAVSLFILRLQQT